VTLLHTSTADALRRRALWLEYLTIGWDVIEAAVAVAAGVAAGSIALVGFGFDSSIGVLAASTVVWQQPQPTSAQFVRARRSQPTTATNGCVGAA
jgi:hypothetical protein